MTMKIIAATIIEGGAWEPSTHLWGNRVFAILFEDGTVWDTLVGFRSMKRCLPDWYGSPSTIDATGWAESLFETEKKKGTP